MAKPGQAVFVDTGIFYAFVDRSDRYHSAAVELLKEAEEQGSAIITSNFVVAETHALILSKLGRSLAAKWLEGVFGYAKVERVTQADEARAKAIIFQYDDKDFSYTDATCFAMMERQQIQAAFSLDLHFVQYGKFTVLPARRTRRR